MSPWKARLMMKTILHLYQQASAPCRRRDPHFRDPAFRYFRQDDKDETRYSE